MNAHEWREVEKRWLAARERRARELNKKAFKFVARALDMMAEQEEKDNEEEDKEP